MRQSTSLLAAALATVGLFFATATSSYATGAGELGPHSPGVVKYLIDQSPREPACANIVSVIPSALRRGEKVCIAKNEGKVNIRVKRGNLPTGSDKAILIKREALMRNPSAYYKKVYAGGCPAGDFHTDPAKLICYAPTLDDYLAGKGFHGSREPVNSVTEYVKREKEFLNRQIDDIRARMNTNYYVTVISAAAPPVDGYFARSKVLYLTLNKNNFPIKRLNNWPHVFPKVPEAKSRMDSRKAAGTLKTAKSLSSSLQQ